MHESKLVRLLQALNAWEIRRLTTYVRSPYVNQHQQVIGLMEVLQEIHPGFTEKSLNRSEIGRRVFGNESYREQQLSDLMTYLIRLVFDFLAQEQYDQDSFQKRLYLGQAYRQRGMDAFNQKHLSRSQPSLSDTHRPQAHFEQYLWEQERVLHLSDHKARTKDQTFQRMVGHFDTYYLMMKLRYGCEMLNRSRVQSQEFDLGLLYLVLDFVAENVAKWPEEPLIEAYYRICRMLQEEAQPDLFFAADQFIRLRYEELPTDLLRDLCAYLLNYCIRSINTGDLSFQVILFEQYQWQLATNVILEGKWLSPWDYKNIVSLGLKMDKFDWTHTFIESYKVRLKVNFRANAYRYNLAVLYYAQQVYGKALGLLQDVEFEDVFYQIGSKAILLKTYYETEDFEALFYLADAAEAYFRRNREIPTYQKEIYLNFIRFLRKLTHLHIRLRSTYRLVEKRQVESLRKRIETKQKVAQMDWLLRKVDRLI